VVTSQVPIAQSAMNQASAGFAGTGTPMAPVFANPNYSAAAISGAFSLPSVIGTIAPATYPQAPTGSGVIPISFSNAPLPLNTNPFATAGRTQLIVKDN